MADVAVQSSNPLLDTLSAIFSFIISIKWSLRISQLLSILYFPFRIILYPLRIIINILLIVFAPVVYIFSTFLSIFNYIIAWLQSLEPLYTFFGAAAGVGIFAGVILAMFSMQIKYRLGMYEEYDDDGSLVSRSSKRSSLYDARRDSSSTELDWQFLDSPTRRRKSAVGLLSQTIHEEEDDSEF